jgi:hypothetical protein
MRRVLIFAAILLPSCVAPNLVTSPAVIDVSAQVVPNPDGTARAFRVDIEEKEQSEPKARYTLSPIPLDEHGWIPQQLPLPSTTNAGYIVKRGPKYTEYVSGEVRSDYAVLVRIYRPGYHTIEIRPGERIHQWHWIKADHLEQEKAIDALLGLLGLPTDEKIGGWWDSGALSPQSELCGSPFPIGFRTLGDSGLQPGSVSASHREILLFATGEYERLAKTLLAYSPGMEKLRGRLEAKASQMKRYADELTTEEFYQKQSSLRTD